MASGAQVGVAPCAAEKEVPGRGLVLEIVPEPHRKAASKTGPVADAELREPVSGSPSTAAAPEARRAGDGCGPDPADVQVAHCSRGDRALQPV